MPKFKGGDKVRAVADYSNQLTEGRVYTVHHYNDVDDRVVIEGNYDNGMKPRSGLYSHRFELVEPAIPVFATGSEADPNGIGQNQPGAKLDKGKLLPSLVLGEFARALEAVAEVGTVGARKYTPRGWLEVPNGEERYREAAMRHQLEVWKGNPVDNGPGGTGKLHKAQVLWNLLAELELELRRAEQT